MKPHIKLVPFGHTTIWTCTNKCTSAIGLTPAEAFAKWKVRMTYINIMTANNRK